MKFLPVVLLAAGNMLAAVSMNAQTADEVVNKHIEALGGKDKLNAIKTVYSEYDMDIMGNQASGITYQVNGKAFRNEMDFGGQKIIQVVTDKGGWGINPMAGQTAAEPMPEDMVKASQYQLYSGGILLDYASKGYTIELQGKEDIGSTPAFKLLVKSREGNETTMWIDAATYHIIKSTSKIDAQGQQMETSTVFSNYKKTDYGLAVPGNAEVTLPGVTLTIISKKVEVNKEVDMKLFEQP